MHLDDCAWARELASGHVDGELSEVEELQLERHIAGCPDCRRYLAELEAATGLIREAALVEPAHRIVMPRRSRGRAWVLSAGAAAAVVVAAVAGGLRLEPAAGPSPNAKSDAAVLRAEYAEQKRVRLLLAHAASPEQPQHAAPAGVANAV